MSKISPMRVVVDTNVVLEGLTKQGSSAGWIIEAWLAGLIEVCISDALAYEYKDVLERKLSEQRWQKIKPILGQLLRKAKFITIYYSWRPTSPDPGDDLVIDCAMNASAMVVTQNIKDFKKAIESLELKVVTSLEFVTQLAGERGKR